MRIKIDRFIFAVLLAATLGVFAAAARPQTVPTPTPAVSVATPSAQTINDLAAAIRSRIDVPEVRRGRIGIKIVSLHSGKVVFEENSEKYFMPASNMKNFTVSAALERLTPDFRYVTSVYASSMPNDDGTVKGDLRIFGRGDVSISTAFFPPEAGNTGGEKAQPDRDSVYFAGIDRLADKIAAAGIKRIKGGIVADETYFKGDPIPSGWEWDDLQWYYGAEVSALPLNDNAVDLAITPGPIGYSCTVTLRPYNPVYKVKNSCITTAAGTPRTLKVTKLLDRNELEISGSLPIGNAGFNESIAVSHPAELFAALLRQRLIAKGIKVDGQYSTTTTPSPSASVEIARLESPPFSVIAAKTLKPSQNMYTETILWTLGEEARKRIDRPTVGPNMPRQADSYEIGLAEVKDFLSSIGISADGIVQYDGSGLSRHNLITPAAVVRLYVYMATQSKFAEVWRDSLTIGGVDGTLANRFKGTAAAGNIRGKTGTIDQVSALSGYITTGGGEQLVLSILVNGVPTPRQRTSLIDDIVLDLANYKGRID